MQSEVSLRIAKATRSLCLQRAIFQNHHLSTETKRKVYESVVLSVLLYGAATWTIKAGSLRQLNGFHNHCVRSILGVSRHRQWKERISTRQLAKAVGMEYTMDDILMEHRLRWLGHVARMEPGQLPKQLLYGELLKRRPCHGVKRRRDVATADLKAMSVGEEWLSLAQDRKAWWAACCNGLAEILDRRRHGAITFLLNQEVVIIDW